nr:F-box protein PP2-B10-like [Ipomoea batatas]
MEQLPEDCISEIVSFTSPVDAAVFSVISKRFKASSESDVVWIKFLPVFHLTRKLGRNVLRLLLDRVFTFTGVNDPIHFITVHEGISRFAEIGVLHLSENLREICGRISCRMLSEEIQYASYLVYRTVLFGYFTPPVKGVCRFVENESREEAEERASLISLDARGDSHFLLGTNVPRNRPDGWLEVEIGSFFNVGRNPDNLGEVESIVFAMGDFSMYLNIIVQGIEFRPKPIV